MFGQLVVDGIAIGAIYALAAIGFVLIFRTIDTFNFFHGEMYMLGAFLGFTLTATLEWPVWIGLPAAVVAAGMASAGLERLCLRPLISAPRPQLLFATAVIGIILLRHVALLIWGADPLTFPPYLPGEPLRLGAVSILPQQVLIIAAAVALIGALYAFFARTRLGKAMRAYASNPMAAVLMGVNAEFLQMFSFGLAGALGGVAGVLISPLFYIDPTMGGVIIVKVFAVTILGGLDSIPGAILAGVVLGIAENLIAGYVSTAFKDGLAFALIIVMLVMRPTGLLGSRALEKV
ncbi:MAG: branched-chain amino acid ABC transporter permease [Candidatus Rokuibacteriota bacterium]